MGQGAWLSLNERFWRTMSINSQLYNSSVILLLTAYTVTSLSVMDSILLRTVEGYQPVDSLWLGAIIFFIAFHIFLHLFKVNQWKSYLRFYVGGLAVFFPLVLLASILRIYLNLSESAFASYTEIYCPAISADVASGESPICGQAFAFIVYSMTVRSLPTVVTIPLLYHWFNVEFPSLVNRLRKKGK